MNSKKSLESEKQGIAKPAFYAIVLTLAAVALILCLAVAFGHTYGEREYRHYNLISGVLSTITTLLLVYLLAKYLEIYFETKSDFTFGLVLLVAAMVLDSIASNNLIHGLVGAEPDGGPFLFIPMVFTLFTAIILLYLARK
ncbi:Uncharacterised protein [uncultured archaeon]|nr:Uncharacterised protein [uncultured archaeon]